MKKPRLLDLFSGAGGAARGYADAGFEVVGVDLVDQPHYPYEFHKADAMTYSLEGFSVIHASPVCKAYTNCNLSPKERYEKLIGGIRTRLQSTGKPYVIENVIGARHDMHASLMLCASMFGLPMQRHRLFESNMFLYAPGVCRHEGATISVVGHSVWDSSLPGTVRRDGRSRPDSVPVEIGHAAMGISWMNKSELAQAIPPAYTQWIGEQLRQILEREEVA